MTPQSSFQYELDRLSELAGDIGPATSLYRSVHWLNERLAHPEAQFTDTYLPIIRQEQSACTGERPFLTVVTRTQGKRTEMLREVMLSLAAQTDQDFELLLVGHKVSPEDQAKLDALLEDFPASLRARVRCLSVHHGTRTTPLNVAFAHARGDYIAVLDDDDLVFDNWVSVFHTAAEKGRGTLLHSYVVTQKWELTEHGSMASKAPGSECCHDFRPVNQLEYNMCPLMSIAFPAQYFQRYGLIFDETLTTTEDWDYIMRLAAFAGVTDIPETTAIYRMWENAENSQSLHEQPEWKRNYARIQARLTQMPVLLQPGAPKLRFPEGEAPYEITPERVALKLRVRKLVPTPVWWTAKKVYRLCGGKKWLG